MGLRIKFCLAFCLVEISIVSAQSSSMLKVLMIGKQEPERYHDPLARYNDFKQPMSSKGIQVDYIDDYSKITDTGLKPYDVILVYTMHYDFAKGAEFGAIRRFVESGKGLVGTHTATVIWGNSEWTKLIGALFEQHNYGDPILLEITNPNHEALKGVPTSIPAFEESYFFDKNSNATDRVILQRRKEMVGARADEWTWVRDQGKGRVYYTAAGHAAAWRTKEFHKQLEVALKWAAGGAQATQIMIGSSELNESRSLLSIDQQGHLSFQIRKSSGIHLFGVQAYSFGITGKQYSQMNWTHR